MDPQANDIETEGVQLPEAITSPSHDPVSLDSGVTMRRFVHQMLLMKDLEADSEPVKTKKALVRYALEEWKAQVKALEERMTHMETDVRNERNEFYQLMSLFSVVGGVVLTAVSTSSRLECQHLWIPIGVCAFSYLQIIVAVNMKARNVLESQELKARYKIHRSRIMDCLDKVEMRPLREFDFKADIDPIMDRVQPKIGNSFRHSLVYSLLPVTGALTCSLAVLVFSCVHTVCWS